jgi:preprotein translocase subunit SecB
MSDVGDQPGDGAPQTETGQGAMIRVMAQYIKDLSFENPGLFSAGPNAPAPDIELSIDVRVEPASPKDGIFGVDLKLTARATRADAVVFIVDLLYGGVFGVAGARPQDVEPLLLVECPRLMFPFARRVVADITREGGHPPLMIEPIDFYGIYRQQQAQAIAAANPSPVS